MRSEFYHSTIEVNDYPVDKLYIKNAEQLDEFIKKFNIKMINIIKNKYEYKL